MFQLLISPDCVFDASLVPGTCPGRFLDLKGLINKFLESRQNGPIPVTGHNGLMRSLGGLVMGSLSAVSEALIGKMRTRARRDCALSIQRLEGSRSGWRWTRVMQIQSRKSRCGSTPGETRESTAPRRENVRVAENSNVVRRG